MVSVYDAEVSEEGDIQMKRYASAFQSTGRDWEEVPLVFVVGTRCSPLPRPPLTKRN